MKTWGQMEKLVETGLVRHIGTSNMTVPKLELVLRDATVPPAVNEMELHPHFQQPVLFDFVRDHGIEPVGYCPLGSPNRPERDRTPEDTNPLEDPVVREIAEAHDVHPAVVCIRWAVQRGQTRVLSSLPLSGEADLAVLLTPGGEVAAVIVRSGPRWKFGRVLQIGEPLQGRSPMVVHGTK